MANGNGPDEAFIGNLVEAALRIGLLLLLLIWSFDIIRPFLMPILWAGILAISFMPLVHKLEALLGGRRGWAATSIALVGVVLLGYLVWVLVQSVLGAASGFLEALHSGESIIPPPGENVKEWPVIGERLYEVWLLANTNLEEAFSQYRDQITSIAQSTLGAVGSGITTALLFIISFLLAAFFIVKADSAGMFAERFANRLFGAEGERWTKLAVDTVRSVSVGVVGVAVIQTILVAIGLFVMQIPAAGIWALIILFLAIAQLPAMIVLLPIIIWVFSTADTTPAVIFAIYSVLAGMSDAFLKPILMGRGVDVPMPVILIGAIGGMIVSGIVGLFVGAVILAVWWELFSAWVSQGEEAQAGEGKES